MLGECPAAVNGTAGSFFLSPPCFYKLMRQMKHKVFVYCNESRSKSDIPDYLSLLNLDQGTNPEVLVCYLEAELSDEENHTGEKPKFPVSPGANFILWQ